MDANLDSNLITFLFEADIEKYLRLADTIEAIFEALPLSILQYVNNELNNKILCEKAGETYLQGCSQNVRKKKQYFFFFLQYIFLYRIINIF